MVIKFKINFTYWIKIDEKFAVIGYWLNESSTMFITLACWHD